MQGSKTILDDYLREVRPLFAPRPQDVSAHRLSAGRGLPVRSLGAERASPGRAWSSSAAAGSSSRVWATRARAPARWSSPRRRRTCSGASRAVCGRWAALPETLVWDRQAGIHAPRRPPDDGVRRALRPAAGRLAVLRAAPIRRPRASSSACRATWRPTSSPAACFANELDYQHQLDGWFDKANARTHKTLRCRPVDRLIAEREAMARAAGVPGPRPALGDAGPGRSLPAL